MKEGRALVMSSGGMDSTSLLALALEERKEVLSVSFRYGSKHNAAENLAAKKVANYYGIENVLIDLPQIFGGAHSSLMGDADTPMPHITYQEILEGEGPSPTVVPFRNANLISLATTLAIVREAQWVYFGPHATDSSHFAYPDCAPPFVGAMQAAVYTGSYHAVQLLAPFQYITKEEVCSVGLRLKAPLHLTWTCYDPIQVAEEEWVADGACPSCIERIAAFSANGVVDPIQYAIDVGWPVDAGTFELME